MPRRISSMRKHFSFCCCFINDNETWYATGFLFVSFPSLAFIVIVWHGDNRNSQIAFRLLMGWQTMKSKILTVRKTFSTLLTASLNTLQENNIFIQILGKQKQSRREQWDGEFNFSLWKWEWNRDMYCLFLTSAFQSLKSCTLDFNRQDVDETPFTK